MMTYRPRISFFVLLILSCSNFDTEAIKNTQIDKLSEVFENDGRVGFLFDYFPNGIIKRARPIDKDSSVIGKEYFFYENGLLKELFFINSEGDTIGDRTIFGVKGNMLYHTFNLNSDIALFYIAFSMNGTPISIRGRPFYIQQISEAKLNDTLVHYVATPIIPFHRTEVTIGLSGKRTQKISYENDIRQMYVKLVPEETGPVKMEFQINIVNIRNEIIVSDSEVWDVVVE